MCHYGGGHCVTLEQSTIAFHFVFLALLTASTPCSPSGMGSFKPALGFGRKRVILRKAAALTSGHGVALQLNSLVLPCWLPISFWLWRGSSWLVFSLASRAGSRLQQPAAPWPHEPLSALQMVAPQQREKFLPWPCLSPSLSSSTGKKRCDFNTCNLMNLIFLKVSW